ncbi:MAG: hypothetical protein AVDCRST_MAG88-4491, partial [uncultured Thermomicrobiales bacterium]
EQLRFAGRAPRDQRPCPTDPARWFADARAGPRRDARGRRQLRRPLRAAAPGRAPARRADPQRGRLCLHRGLGGTLPRNARLHRRRRSTGDRAP